MWFYIILVHWISPIFKSVSFYHEDFSFWKITVNILHRYMSLIRNVTISMTYLSHSFIHTFIIFLIGAFYVTHATRALEIDACRERELTLDHTYFFDHTRTWRASPDEGSAQCRATSKTIQTRKTIHTIHAPIHSNKANMKGCLRRPNDIRGPDTNFIHLLIHSLP